MIGDILHYPLLRWVALANLALISLIALRLVFPAASIAAIHFARNERAEAQRPARAPAPQTTTIRHDAVIAERPLFIESRRMPKEDIVPETPAQAGRATIALTPASSLDGLTLTGIVMAEGARVAILKAQSGESPAGLKEGDDYRGWHVARIEPEAVLFTRDNDEKRLEFAKPKPGGVVIGTGGTGTAPPHDQIPESQIPRAGK